MVSVRSKPLVQSKDAQFLIIQDDQEERRTQSSRGFIWKVALRFLVIFLFALTVSLTFAFLVKSMKQQYVSVMDHSNSFSPEIDAPSLPYVDRYIAFMAKYSREYTNNQTMEKFKNYEKSLKYIELLNEQETYGAVYGENDLSDWSDEEFAKTLLPKTFYKTLRKEATFIRNDPPTRERAAPLPEHFDWRDKNVITPVKAQGQCGSCWAFAATATVEAAYAISHGEKRNLSEQTLLDCDFADNACDGGDEDKAFRYIHRNGLAYATELPYVAHRQNSCSVHGNVTKIEVAYFLHPDEKSMIDWLVNFGPVNIGISVTQPMRAYKEGVFWPNEDDCKNKVIGLHALMIVGYGVSERGEPYWIVKNSWGDTWGTENGYVYFARGVNACGIEDEPIGILA
ncbi:unnamed protein product [Auanema sp. JU1783]|nr:unnamed protein product [Auanema sp. JU1783]